VTREPRVIVEKLIQENKEDVTTLNEIIELLQKAVRRIAILNLLGAPAPESERTNLKH
jgi:hypothetical protein